MNLCGETLSGLVRHRARRVESHSVQSPFDSSARDEWCEPLSHAPQCQLTGPSCGGSWRLRSSPDEHVTQFQHPGFLGHRSCSWQVRRLLSHPFAPACLAYAFTVAYPMPPLRSSHLSVKPRTPMPWRSCRRSASAPRCAARWPCHLGPRDRRGADEASRWRWRAAAAGLPGGRDET